MESNRFGGIVDLCHLLQAPKYHKDWVARKGDLEAFMRLINSGQRNVVVPFQMGKKGPYIVGGQNLAVVRKTHGPVLSGTTPGSRTLQEFFQPLWIESTVWPD